MTQGLLLSDWNSHENQMVLVNARGKIFMVNEAWRHDDVQHGMSSPHCLETSVGDDWSLYQDMPGEKTEQTRAGIAAVLAGKLSSFTLTYSDSTEPQRRFVLTVAPVNPLRHGLIISKHPAQGYVPLVQ
jgi:hypothetical protein